MHSTKNVTNVKRLDTRRVIAKQKSNSKEIATIVGNKDTKQPVDCWEKKENKDKCPKGFKYQREKVVAATNSGDTGSRVKFLLYGSPEMSFPDVQELLDDPNVWIGDTAATVDMTPYKEGITNLRMHSLKR